MPRAGRSGGEPVVDDPTAADPLATTTGWGRWAWPIGALVVGAVVAGVVLRFVTRSPLWLDEALSVNIARLPLGEIGGALRHDGHPPLYYVLLHGWMTLFGEGDVAVRAFSGVWALALLPLVWVAGRRMGGTRVATYAVAVVALLPFAVRYGTEARMYAMVSVLALVGWLLVYDALRQPRPLRLVGVAAVTGMLLWSHYWAFYLLATAGVWLLLRLWRERRAGLATDARATLAVIAAMVVGGLTFLPWLGNFLYQGRHTGTPWARPVRPTEMVTFLAADLGGGPLSESVLLGWFLMMLLLLGLFGRTVARTRVEIDIRTQPDARSLPVLMGGTLAVACVAGYLTKSTFATRYASMVLPFIALAVALGIDRFRSRPVVAAILAVVIGLGAVGSVRNVVTDRSDAERSAAAIEAAGQPGDLVVYCPDQLGPSTNRVLAEGFDERVYPSMASPELVDWVDYDDRLDAASPSAFAEQVDRDAGDRRVFLVTSSSYTTHTDQCPAIQDALAGLRPAEVLSEPSDAYEPSSVIVFGSPGG